MIRNKDKELLSKEVASRVVSNLMGSMELQEIVMDEISRVLYTQFGADGLDDSLEEDIMFTALQRIVLIDT